jgi:DNA-binding NarL/FixJ family response regulator
MEFGLLVGTKATDCDVFRAHETKPKLLVVGVPDSEIDILHCIEAGGASGYVLKDASLGDLLSNIEAIKRGETLCSPRIAGLAFRRVSTLAHGNNGDRQGITSGLTRREEQIIKLVEEGLTNKEIAVDLRIEVSTVKNHVHNILDKLQLQDRYAAARRCKELGVLAKDR